MSALLRADLWRLIPWLLAALALPASAQLSYERALQLAHEQSAQLQARRAAVEGAAALEGAASQLPDPRLGVGIDNLPINTADRFSLTRDFMTQRQLGWTQDVPNAAKRQARADTAAARTVQERAKGAAEGVMVEREASKAWLAAFHAVQRRAAFDALARENEVLLGTVHARIASGKALPAEATLVRQEALALDDRRDELDRDVAKARAALRRWVGAAADEALQGEPPALPLQLASLRGALATHAELAAYAPMADVARAEAREFEAAKKGDWSWGVTLSKRGPAYSDMVSVQLSFELPLWAAQRQDPQTTARRKEAERIEAEAEDLRRRLVLEIETQLAEDAELGAKLSRLKRQMLPLAEERVALTLASYQAGKADLAAVIASRKDVIETRLRAIELSAQQAALRAQLNTHFLKEHP